MRPDYLELSEQFRFFHRLFEDRDTGRFVKIDDGGREEVIATSIDSSICVRLREVRQYLAIREMVLLLQFDIKVFSLLPLAEIGIEEGGQNVHEGDLCYGLHFDDIGEVNGGRVRGFSRLIGFRVVHPLPKEKSGFPGFAEDTADEPVSFIIGVDDVGEPLTYSSDPDGLANYFGANPDAPNYITRVEFDRKVLDRYYQQPSRYSVEGSYLRCGSLWGMTIDNHSDERVIAWLGDLGRDLPYHDRLHWRGPTIGSRQVK